MKVDMNNLRKQAVFAYNGLCKSLHEGINTGVFEDSVSVDDDFQEVIDEIGEIACFGSAE